MKHFLNVFAHIWVSTLVVFLIGAGVQFGGSIFGAIALSGVVSLVTLFIGVFALIATRMLFKLKQAGRLAECLYFWLTGAAVVTLTGSLLPAWLTVTSALGASFLMLAGVVVLAFLTGNLKSFGRRSWLPVRQK